MTTPSIKLPYTLPASGILPPQAVSGNFEFLRDWVADIANQVDTLTNLTVTNAASVGGTLGVTGAATLSSSLGVTGAATLSSTLSNTNKLITDSSGNVTQPNQPNFLALGPSVSTTGFTGGATFIFGNEVYDTAGNYNNATGVFTAPVAGNYFFSVLAPVGLSGASPGTNIYVSLVTTQNTYQFKPSVVTSAATGIFSLVAQMAANDTTFILVATDLTKTAIYGDLTLDGKTRSFFSGTLLN